MKVPYEIVDTNIYSIIDKKQIQYNIMGIKIYPFKDKNKLLDFIKYKKQILIAVNAEKIVKSDPKLIKLINNNIGYPDGTGAVLALKKKGANSVRIPGVELWLDIIHKYYKNKTFYFIGSSQDVIEKTINKIKIQFPEINIIGFRNGYLEDYSKEQLKNELIVKQPNIVFVAQGSPRQEFLMDELMKVHPALYMGLGGSFDVYCGRIKRAPIIFRKLYLEWFFRLLKEPTRIRRQLSLLKFIFLLSIKKM